MKKLGRSIVNKSVKILVLLLLLASSFKGYGQSYNLSKGDVSCFGGSNGLINVQVLLTNNCGPGPYKYAIYLNGSPTPSNILGPLNFSPTLGPAFTASFTGLAPGSYYIEVWDVWNNDTPLSVCETTEIPITQPPQLVANAFPTNVTCNGGNNGSINVAVSGGATGQGATNVCKGYNVSWSGTAAGGDPLCVCTLPGNPSGCVVEIPTSSPTIGGSYNIPNLSAGPYVINVKDYNGCTYPVINLTITQPSPLEVINTLTNVPCNGGTGSILVSPTGGTPGYNVSWGGPSSGNPNGNTPETVPYNITPLGVGNNYSVTVTDVNGCSSTQNNIAITQPPALQVTSSTTPVLCFNGTSGTATFTVSGGVAGYNLSWTGPTPGSPPGFEIAAVGGSYTASNLAAGDYVFTITDNGGGCSATVNVTITQPLAALAVSTTAQNILCFGANNGSILVYGTGGTPQGNSPVNGYNVSWSGQASGNPAGIEIPTSNPNIISGYYTIGSLVPGNYAVTLTDVNNCTSVANITITQPPQVFLSQEQVNNNCFTGQTGSIDLTVVGGTPFGGAGGTYQYLWSNTQTTQDVNNLPNGVYSVVVTDANACQTSFPNITITSPPALVVTASTTQPICYNQTGAINVTVTGGVQGYSYVWSNGFTTQDLSNLTAGSYTITVMDANGCTMTGTWVINASPPALTMTLSPTHPLCHNAANGSILVTVNGGVPTYSISGTAPLSVQTITPNGNGGNNTYTYQGLSSGSYTITATDANGCLLTQTVILNNPAQLSVSGSSVAVGCSGGTNGQITFTATGGTGTLNYSTVLPTGSGTALSGVLQTIPNVSAGTYQIQIVDANNCTANVNVIVNEPFPLLLTETLSNSTCNGLNNGGVSLLISGGTAAYSFQWTGLLGGNSIVIPSPTQQNQSNLSPGTYTVVVTDANGCTATETYTITQPTLLSVQLLITDAINCFGQTGEITATVNGGTANYTLSGIGINQVLSPPTLSYVYPSLLAGTYTITVSDGNGCTDNEQIVLTQPNPLSLSATSQGILCNGGTTTVTLSQTGGTPAYTYTGSPLINLGPGNYNYTVTDANSCTANTSIVITQPSALVVTAALTTPIACSGGQGTVTVSATGGSPSYIGTGTFTVSAGTHTFTVTDANGCTNSATITVTQPNPLVATASIVTPILCNGGQGVIEVIASGGTASYTGVGNFNVFAGTYTYSITDANGCIAQDVITINQPTAIVVTPVLTSPILCNGGTGQVTVSATGGTLAYASGIGLITVTSGANQVFTVVDANGCQGTANLTITQPTQLTASATLGVPIPCHGGTTTVTVSASGGTANYSGTGTFTVSAGPYSYTVTDANGCQVTVTGTITEPSTLSVNSTPQQITCFGANNGSIAPAVSGGTPAYSFLWSGTDFSGNPIAIVTNTQQNQSNLGPGNYSVQITDLNGCILNSQTWAITNPLTSPNIQIIGSQDVNCFGYSTGSISFLATGGTPDYDVELNGVLQGNIALSGGQFNILNLLAGVYTLEIIDNNGCVDTEVITIDQPNSAVSAVVDNVTNVSCYGLSDGEIFASVTGGTAPYSFLWSVSGGVGGPIPAGEIASEDPQGLPDGNYQLLVTDAYGCTTTVITVVTEPTPINIVWQDSGPLCDGNSLGFINLQLSGGTPNQNSPLYNTSWQWAPLLNPGINCSATNIPPNTFTASLLTCGIYTVTVTDANGCATSYSDSIIITPTPFQANFTSTNILCFGNPNGSITVTPTNGTAPYNVVITPTSPPVIDPQGPEIFNVLNSYTDSLPLGTYLVSIIDNNGCQDDATITITAPQAPIIASISSFVNVSCFGDNDGSFNVGISGGTPPYTFNVDPFGPAPPFSQVSNQLSIQIPNLSANSYSVTVLDANQCASAAVVVTINEPAALQAIITGSAINCFGDCNGGISSAVSGGTLPYAYQWTDGVTTWNSQNISSLCAGNYQFNLLDANNCPFATSYTVIQPQSAMVVTVIDVNDLSCYGANNGQVQIAVNGGTPNYIATLGGQSQSINPNIDNTATFPNLSPGTYVLSVTDANGCGYTQNITITTPPALTLSVVPTNILCAGQTTGQLLLTANGGVPNLTYVISGPSPSNGIIIGGTPLQIGGILNPPSLAQGAYTVVVTDLNGCSDTVSTNITVPNPIQIVEQIIPVDCHGLSTGQIIPTVSGGAGGYTYSWVASNGGVLTAAASAASQINLPAGTYQLTVSDANNCTLTEIYVVTEPQLILSASVSSFTNVSCGNLANGQITIAISGGTPNYTVSGIGAPQIVNPANGNTAQFQNLTGGNYTLTIIDNNGCSVNVNQIITQPAPLTLGITSTTNVLCNGASTGSLSFTTSGGTAPINYNIVGPPSFSGTIASTAVTVTPISAIPAGTYTVNLSDANGCTQSISTTITQPQPIVVTPTITPILCFGQGAGAISTSVSGAVGPYTYQWSTTNGNIPGSSITSNISNVPAGSYTLTVTDANGCPNVQTWAITEPALALSMSLSPPVNISCNPTVNNNYGSIQVTASGGTAGYQVTYQRTSPPGPLVSLPGIEIPLSGGSYSIPPILTAGNYTLTVIDANGCSIQDVFTITEPPVFGATVSVNTILCNPGNTGVLTITTPPGSYPVTYVINGPGGPYSGNINTSPFLLNNLPGGNYTIDLTYNNGLCTQQLSATINQPANPISVNPAVTNVLCAGVNSGSICLTPTGGTGPYTYQWSTTNGNIPGNANCQNNLAPDIYNVTVTDANGCFVPNTYTISGPVSPLVADSSFTNVLCLGQNDGTITIITNGGSPIYTLTSATLTPASAIINLAGGSYQYSNVSAGIHEVHIIDNNGCEDSITVTITQPQNPLSATNIAVTDVQCFGDMNGSIAFNVIGGTAPYTISWSAPALPAICAVPASTVSNSGVIAANGLCQGAYTITITDLNNCPHVFTQSIVAPNAPLTATATQTNNPCFGYCTGIATTVPSGGTAPYQHSWSNGQTTPSITGLCIGDYYDTITDANGCVIIVQFSITAPAQAMVVSISHLNVACFDDATGSIAVNVVGGTPGYNVSWTPGPPFPVAGLEINNSGGTYTIAALLAGTYSIIVEDLNNCPETLSVIITQPTALTYAVTSNNITCNGASDGVINITVNGGVPAYSYVWTSTAGAPCSIPINQSNATGLCPGNYSVVVTDLNGCNINTSAIISEPAPLLINVNNDTVYCLPLTGSAQAIVSGGTPLYAISWLNASGTNIGNGLSILGLAPGVYSAVVTDANACTSNAVFNIIGPANPLTATISQTNETCTNNNDGTITIIPSGGTAPYTIYGTSPPWNGTQPVLVSGGNSVSNNMVAGTYTYDIFDSYGCTTSVTTTITEPTYLQAAVSILNVTCNGSNDGNITITPSGATPNYTISWLSGPNSGPCILPVSQVVTGVTSYPNLCPGTYVFEITDLNGCDTTISATILEPTALVLTPSNTDVLCYGIPTGEAGIAVSGGTPTYSYLWTTTNGNIPGSSTTANIGSSLAPNGLTAGTYQVVVTDANNCTSSTTININQPISALLAGISHTDELCFPIPNAISTGTITIGANGGTAPYTIIGQNLIWTGTSIIPFPTILPPVPPSGQTMINVPANSNGAPYTFIVQDANLCLFQLSVVVGSPTALAVTSIPTNVLCTGDQTGAILITPSGGVSPYTVDWLSPLANGPCILPVTSTISAPYTQAGLCAGNYIISITDANGCPDTISVPITEPVSLPSSTASQINNPCYGDALGVAGVSAFGGTPGYTYSWTTTNGNIPGPSTTPTIGTAPNGLIAGTYTATITDANGCTTTNTVIITEPGTAIGAAATSTPVSCNTYLDGTITVTAIGGTPPYLISGVTVPFSATIPNITNTPATLSGLAAGVYLFTVTDANGCSITVSSTVTQPFPLVATGVSTNILCYGDSDGTISLTITGGTPGPGYSYSWSGPGPIIPAAGPNITGLNIGNYSVVVTDANGCTTPVYNFNITQPPVIASTYITSNNNCHGDSTGAISVAVTGGTAPYTYEWHIGTSTGPIIPLQTAQNISNLPAGQYTLVITDANNCVHTETATILEPSSAITVSAITTNIFCFGDFNGTISPVVSGGVSPYTYQWNGPSPNMPNTNLNQISLGAGTYTFIVTDDLLCSAVYNYTIVQPLNPISFSYTTTDNLCYGDATGQISMTVSGGTPGYSFLWSNPSNIYAATESISNLPIGSYSLQVTDNFGCTANVNSIQIIQPLPIVFNYPSTYIDIINCFGDNDANIYTSVAGGTPSINGYTYVWTASNGGVIPIGQGASPNLNIITPGSYNLSVTDANGCVKDTTFIIIEPPALVMTLSADTINCFGDSTGIISVALQGGTASYDISWAGPTQGNPNGAELLTAPGLYLINNLPEGTYTITAIDYNGCTVSMQETIIQSSQIDTINVSVSKPLCHGDSNGSIIVGAIIGGTPSLINGYSYSWSASQGGIILPGQAGPFIYNNNPINLSGLPAGIYTLSIIDSLNCERQFNITVSNPDSLTLEGVTFNNISCKGACSGQILFDPNGGTAGYSVNLLYYTGGTFTVIATKPIYSQDETLYPDSLYSFDGLCPGQYIIQIYDANNCSINYPSIIILTEPATSMGISASVLSNSGCNNDEGEISVSAFGGLSSYNVEWQEIPSGQIVFPSGNIATSGGNYSIDSLGGGTYIISVTDANGCTIDTTLFINSINNLIASFDLSDTIGCAPLTINFTNTTVGTGLSFEWIFTNGTTSNQEDPSIVFSTPGDYSVTLIANDANGCSDTLSMVDLIYIFPIPTASFQATTAEIDYYSGLINFINNSTNAQFYSWDFGDFSLDSEEENPGHIYPAQTNGGYIVTLIATDTNGCTDQAQAYFVINETLVLNVPNSITINDDGINEAFKPVFSNNEMVAEYYLSIYNRWGQIVFETNDLTLPWDGTYKGLKVQIGSYNWQITYKDDNFIEKTISGHVNLLR